MREVGRAPLTFGQLSTWRSIYKLPPENAVSANMTRRWRLPEGCTVTAAKEALDVMQQRHHSLRTGYERIGEEGVQQKLWEVSQAPVEVVDAGDDPFATADKTAASLGAQPFDLANELPWRLAIVASSGEAKYVAIGINHMAADGSAVDLLRNELISRLTGTSPVDTPMTCLELAEDEQSSVWAARRRTAVEYWRKTLSAATAQASPSTGDGVVQWSTLKSAPALNAVQQLAERLGASLTTTVLAAYCRTLADRLGTDELLLGIISANRSLPRSRTMITSLNQLIPLRVHLKPGEELPALIQRLQWETLIAYRHGSYCVDDLESITNEFGYNGVGVGFKYFFNFIPAIPGGLWHPRPANAEPWVIQTATEGRNNGFSSYFRGRNGDQLLDCTLRESTLEADGDTAREALTASSRSFLLAFQDALLEAEALTPTPATPELVE